MSSIIFKNERVKKSEWYAWFLSKWVEAGWTDISSNHSTDGAVMYSTGEKGDKTLYIGFGGDIQKTNTLYHTLKINNCRTYTPNIVDDTAGSFELGTYAEIPLLGDIDPIHLDEQLNMWYYVTKNWGMFVIEANLVRGGYSQCFFVGQPEEIGPGDKTAIIIAGSKINESSIGVSDNIVQYTGNPYSAPNSRMYLTIYTAWKEYIKTTQQVLDNKFCSTIAIGDSAIGYKFKLDDSILIMKSNFNISNFNINGQVYRFFFVGSNKTYFRNSFYNMWIGIRIK